MKTLILFLTLCAAATLAEKQIEVLTQESGVVEDEVIIVHENKQWEEHRNNITDQRGVVQETVLVKIFSLNLMVSYNHNDMVCFVAPLDPDDEPFPIETFEEETTDKNPKVSNGDVLEEEETEMTSVDVPETDIPPQVREVCGERTLQVLRVGYIQSGSENRVKRRGWKHYIPYKPKLCKKRIAKKKCVNKKKKFCCKRGYYWCVKYCKKVKKVCFKTFVFVKVPCHGKKHWFY